MSSPLLETILRLPIDERVVLAHEILDTIACESDDMPFTPAQLAELGRRLNDPAETATPGRTWPEIRDELLHGR